jgi:hypothetical protein
VCCAASSNRKETGGLIMFGTEQWGYGGYGQFHMVISIMLAIAVVAGVVWHLRSGFFVMRAEPPSKSISSSVHQCP